MAKVGQHPPLAEQLAALAGEIEDVRRGGDAKDSALVEKATTVLMLARQLAVDIADATRASVELRSRWLVQGALDELDGVRAHVRHHPLRSVGLAALCGALLALRRRRSAG